MSLQEIRHPAIEIALVYATSDNLTGRRIYDRPIARLHPEAASALHTAADLAAALGLRVQVLDAFRPAWAQRALWAALPNPEFVADPNKGSDHTRGVAVDLTLIDANGRPLDMATGFDEPIPRSHHGRTDISPQALRNRLLLAGIMGTVGFRHNPFEWWHYSLENAASFPLLDG